MLSLCRERFLQKIKNIYHLLKMPLVIDGIRVNGTEIIASNLWKDFPLLKERSCYLLSNELHQIDGVRSLYVSQREYAILTPSDAHIDVMGSDDATTCHVIVIRHTGSGVVCLSHLDGWKTEECIKILMNEVSSKSKGGPEGRFEVFACGGFIDDRGESIKLTSEILGGLHNCADEVHLQVACVSDKNDTLKGSLHFPVNYGLAVNVKKFEIMRACFTDKGPDVNLRSSPIFTGTKKMTNVYDNSNGHLVVGPYSWSPQQDMSFWIQAPDKLIREHLSTSPAQEPEGYESHVRESLLHIHENPYPQNTLFPNGARRYKKLENGQWSIV